MTQAVFLLRQASQGRLFRLRHFLACPNSLFILNCRLREALTPVVLSSMIRMVLAIVRINGHGSVEPRGHKHREDMKSINHEVWPSEDNELERTGLRDNDTAMSMPMHVMPILVGSLT